MEAEAQTRLDLPQQSRQDQGMHTPPVALVTCPGLAAGGDLVACIDAALQAAPEGTVVELHEPTMSGRALCALAGRLLDCCRRAGARLFVSGRADVAVAVRADGLHLTHRDLAPDLARRVWSGPLAINVLSWELAQTYAGRVSYARMPLATYRAGDMCQRLAAADCPLLVHGRLDHRDIPQVMSAGAAGVAVTRGVLTDLDPGAAMGLIKDALRGQASA